MMAKIRFSSGEIIESDGDTILNTALRAGLGFPYECNSGSCGVCKFVLENGDVESLYPDAPAISRRDLKKNRKLACQCKPKSDLNISVNLNSEYCPGPIPVTFNTVLQRIEEIVGGIFSVRLEIPDDLEFLAGQYGLITLPRVGRRAYSMANYPGDGSNYIEFFIKRVPGGTLSEQLTDSKNIGLKVRFDGPFGFAHIERSKRDIICLAGGSGLAPMVSIARFFNKKDDGRNMKFLFGARTSDDLLTKTEFFDLIGKKNQRIEYLRCVSHQKHISSTDEAGYLHEVLMENYESSLLNFDIFCAGPPPMVDAVASYLSGIGFPLNQLFFDRFY